jgi:hypothetical protein
VFRGLSHDLYSLSAFFSDHFSAIGLNFAQPSLNICGIVACRHDCREPVQCAISS